MNLTGMDIIKVETARREMHQIIDQCVAENDIRGLVAIARVLGDSYCNSALKWQGEMAKLSSTASPRDRGLVAVLKALLK